MRLGNSILYSYQGRSADIDFYNCPKLFDTLAQAEFDAKVTAIYWSLQAISEPALIIDCQSHQILRQNHAFNLLNQQNARQIQARLMLLPQPILIITFIL